MTNLLSTGIFHLKNNNNPHNVFATLASLLFPSRVTLSRDSELNQFFAKRSELFRFKIMGLNVIGSRIRSVNILDDKLIMETILSCRAKHARSFYFYFILVNVVYI